MRRWTECGPARDRVPSSFFSVVRHSGVFSGYAMEFFMEVFRFFTQMLQRQINVERILVEFSI